jgi:hypothetical protein
MFNPIIALMIRKSWRSWWQCRYSDGRVLSEWDTLVDVGLLPVGSGRSSRWEDVPKANMMGLRLLCPNGKAGELMSPEGAKFFQLKQGYLDIAMAGGKSNRSVGAHIIGVVKDANGNCLCKAWNYQTKRLETFEDNIYNMKYGNIGKLSLEVQGLKV